jgi:hypothetical protein
LSDGDVEFERGSDDAGATTPDLEKRRPGTLRMQSLRCSHHKQQHTPFLGY